MHDRREGKLVSRNPYLIGRLVVRPPSVSHIEIIVLAPKAAPIPITNTGYLSHFLDEEHLATAGGPVAFFLDWIEREARTKQWAKAEFKWRQLELFAQ